MPGAIAGDGAVIFTLLVINRFNFRIVYNQPFRFYREKLQIFSSVYGLYLASTKFLLLKIHLRQPFVPADHPGHQADLIPPT